jgi:hypothetical protein
MSRDLANFCRENAKRCRQASEKATTEELKSYWQEAEAQWLSRCAALNRSEAEIPEDINFERRSQDEPVPRNSTRFAPEVLLHRISISLDRVKEWFSDHPNESQRTNTRRTGVLPRAGPSMPKSGR